MWEEGEETEWQNKEEGVRQWVSDNACECDVSRTDLETAPPRVPWSACLLKKKKIKTIHRSVCVSVTSGRRTDLASHTPGAAVQPFCDVRRVAWCYFSIWELKLLVTQCKGWCCTGSVTDRCTPVKKLFQSENTPAWWLINEFEVQTDLTESYFGGFSLCLMQRTG